MLQHKLRNVASLFAVALLAAACGVGPNNRARTLGGTVTNLKGTGLVLQFNGGDDLTIDPGATTFKFDSYTADSWPYEVTVLKQPTNPSQTCTVENGSGTTDGADVTSVAITCITNTYTVEGSVSGLLGNGAGLVLQLNGGEKLPIAVAGKFAFSSKIESGAAYAVTVATQPAVPAQTCSISDQSGTGTVGGADVTNVTVTCVINTVSTYVIGGSVSGLLGNGAGLVLQLNDGEELPVAVAGKFAFSLALERGATYTVTVAQQPTSPAQTCSVASGTGVVGVDSIVSVSVTCSTNPFTVAGVIQGLSGSGLVLKLNDDEHLSIASNGAFSFKSKLASGSTYLVTIATQPADPSQTCTVENGSGVGGSTDIANVLVTCSSNAYSVGGTVSGLAGSGLVLQLNGQNELQLTASGNFQFQQKVASGSAYSVSVKIQPSGQTCTVANGSGPITNRDVTNVALTCWTLGVQVTTSGRHTCGLKIDGTVGCWGLNTDGQATPPSAAFRSVSAGAYHTCGITTDAAVRCWGYNTFNQVAPVPSGDTLAVATGCYHACAVKSDNTVVCWGDSSHGKTSAPSGAFRTLGAGCGYTCGIKTDATLACWGENSLGQATPPPGTFKYIAAQGGFGHMCAVKGDGAVSCWGSNLHGKASPPAGSFLSVVAGGEYSCGLRIDGIVVCWGDTTVAGAVPPSDTFLSISSGFNTTCGVKTDGLIACWGRQSDGAASLPLGW